MQITCPECKGRRIADYVEWPNRSYVSDKPTVPADMSVRITRDQACRKCNGAGVVMATERIPVIQYGIKVGTVPPDFDPARLRSSHWLYDVRPGDFRREGDTWVASPSLGGGDLEAVPGFVWEREWERK